MTLPCNEMSGRRGDHGALIAIHDDDLLDVLSIVNSGVKRTSIKLAHNVELEKEIIVDLLRDQVKTGKKFAKLLDGLVQYPTSEQINEYMERSSGNETDETTR